MKALVILLQQIGFLMIFIGQVKSQWHEFLTIIVFLLALVYTFYLEDNQIKLYLNELQ